MEERRLELALGLYDPRPGTKLWHGGASVLGALRGVAAKEAHWKPAPDRHSIWELALHVAYWKYAVRRRISGEEQGAFPRSPSNWPAVPDAANDKAWKEDRALLRHYHDLLAESMRGFPRSRLDESSGGQDKYSYLDLMLGIVLHDTYHAGQIQIMKRIYKSSKK